MFPKTAVSLGFLTALASAHFSIEYPEWRGDSFQAGASQYITPCANVNQTASTNRTLWPLTGGSVAIESHHAWTYVFINLGLGTDYPALNISLTPQPLNLTGNGTLCLPQMTLPAGLSPVDGQNASIQVVTVGQSGTALYNCADITFSSTAQILSGDSCRNSSNIAVEILEQAQQSNSSTSTSENSASTTSTTPSSGAPASTSSPMGMASMIAALGAVVMSCLL